MENTSSWMSLVPNDNIFRYYAKIADKPIYTLLAVIDIVLVALLVNYLIKKLKNTRVIQLFKGILLLLLIDAVSYLLKLPILHAIFSSITTYGVLILIIIFQPEVRKMLEQMGTGKITEYFGFTRQNENKIMKENIYKVSIACSELAKTKTGALIVFEKDIKLEEVISNGIAINADVSVQLLRNIFIPNTPLHDGAVIISDEKIRSACSILPLTTDTNVNKAFGTRHRAAIGISQNSDAIAVVVSEETGKISVAKEGNLIVDLDEDALRKVLIRNLVHEENNLNSNSNNNSNEE